MELLLLLGVSRVGFRSKAWDGAIKSILAHMEKYISMYCIIYLVVEVAVENEDSVFVEFFGGSPAFRIIDFLFEHRLQDFTKTEISRGAGISWATLFNYWDLLEKKRIVKPTRTIGRVTLYQINEAEPIVKELKRIEMLLIRQAADAEEEKVVAVAKPRHAR